MAYPVYLRERARELRIKKMLSFQKIAERLALPKTTVWYWIKDLPLGRERRWSVGQRKGNLAMQNKWWRLHQEAYAAGLVEWEELGRLPTFREFVALYIAEGSKRCRNVSVQYHADQDLDERRAFWGEKLGIDGSTIRLRRKSNSGQLNGGPGAPPTVCSRSRQATRTSAPVCRPGSIGSGRSGG